MQPAVAARLRVTALGGAPTISKPPQATLRSRCAGPSPVHLRRVAAAQTAWPRSDPGTWALVGSAVLTQGTSRLPPTPQPPSILASLEGGGHVSQRSGSCCDHPPRTSVTDTKSLFPTHPRVSVSQEPGSSLIHAASGHRGHTVAT